MPKVEQVICDRCPAVKGEGNRWWIALVWPGCIQIIPYGDVDLPSCDRPDCDPKVRVSYLCGRACVIAAVSEFLGGTEAGAVGEPVRPEAEGDRG